MMNNLYCPACGRGLPTDANFCSSCGAAIAAPPAPKMARLVRPRHPRMIAGVCSGFALANGWDLALVRILFAVFTLLTSGFGLVVYLIAWVVMPDAQYALAASTMPASTEPQGSTV